jgi:hypothetical protein
MFSFPSICFLNAERNWIEWHLSPDSPIGLVMLLRISSVLLKNPVLDIASPGAA